MYINGRTRWTVLGSLIFFTILNLWRSRFATETRYEIKQEGGAEYGRSEEANPGGDETSALRSPDEAHLQKIGELYAGRGPGGRLMKGIYENDIQHLNFCTYCTAVEDYSLHPMENREDEETLGVLIGQQSFVDDYLIFDKNNVKRVVEKPVEFDKPIIKATERWENMVAGPGTTNHNGTHFIMHYHLNKHMILKAKDDERIWGTRVDELVAFASSKDGLAWKKQKIHFIDTSMEHEGIMHAPGGSSCVLYDKFPREPNKRYIMTYSCTSRSKNAFKFDNLYEYSYTHRRVPQHTCLATSPDGIEWVDHGRKFGMMAIQPCLHHERKGGNYTFILRKDFHTRVVLGQMRGAQILTISEAQFDKYLGRDSPLPFETLSEFYLDRNGKDEVYKHTIHGLSLQFNVGGVYVGIASIRHWPYLPDGGDWKKHFQEPIPNTTVLPYFVTSRDGVHLDLTRIYKGEIMPLGEGLDLHFIFTSARSPTVDGYHWVYYAGQPEKYKKRWKNENPIRLAKFKEGRISGLTASDREEEATIETKKFLVPDRVRSLVLNLALGNDDSCKVSVQLQGAFTDIGEVNFGDEPCVTFGTLKDPMQAHSDTVKLKFKLNGQALLYGFTLSSNGCPGSSSRMIPARPADSIAPGDGISHGRVSSPAAANSNQALGERVATLVASDESPSVASETRVA